jgi:hypothetical protein
MPLAKRILRRNIGFASASLAEAAASSLRSSELDNFSSPTYEIYHYLGAHFARPPRHHQSLFLPHDRFSKVPIGMQQRPSLHSPGEEATTQIDTIPTWNPNQLQSLEINPSVANRQAMVTDMILPGRTQNDWTIPAGVERQNMDFRDSKKIKDEE